MTRLVRVLLASFAGIAWTSSVVAADDSNDVKVSGSATALYYAMRDQADFAVGVGLINRGPLHLEARYNYEAHDAGSLFAGWNFSGGETLTFQITPLIGVLFGSARGIIPGFEASVAYGSVDAYIEAEYVADQANHDDSYYYAWSELGWKPVDWLRLGLVGQRTRTVHTDRDLQRGAFAQVIVSPVTLSLYAFNPDSASRYMILALGLQF